jgi:hypothetical protein
MNRDNSYLIGNQFAIGSKPNKTCFRKGNVPWNKGKKGIHLSRKSEFKKGSVPVTKAEVGEVRFRCRTRDGKKRAWVKVAEPNIWKPRAVVVWQQMNGDLLPGYVIHHIDGDSLNDDISNLVALTRKDHLKVHRKYHDEAKRSMSMKAAWQRKKAKAS